MNSDIEYNITDTTNTFIIDTKTGVITTNTNLSLPYEDTYVLTIEAFDHPNIPTDRRYDVIFDALVYKNMYINYVKV